MTPELFSLIERYGVPLVFAVAAGWALYRTLKDQVVDARAQRDRADVRSDAAVAGLGVLTKAVEDLSTSVRDSRKGS